MPFNPERFDAVMAYLSKAHGRELTQRDMVKLHVMTDVFHVLAHGRQIIGGKLERWKGGAVVNPAYRRVRRFGYEWDQNETQPEHFRITGARTTRKLNRVFNFAATLDVDQRQFSESELAAMERAWACVMSKSESDFDAFFHSPDTFMGRAWQKAGKDGAAIAWDEIVDAYADLNPDYSIREEIKTLLSF